MDCFHVSPASSVYAMIEQASARYDTNVRPVRGSVTRIVSSVSGENPGVTFCLVILLRGSNVSRSVVRPAA